MAKTRTCRLAIQEDHTHHRQQQQQGCMRRTEDKSREHLQAVVILLDHLPTLLLLALAQEDPIALHLLKSPIIEEDHLQGKLSSSMKVAMMTKQTLRML